MRVALAPPSGRQLTSLTLSPDLVVGGLPVQGTVTLASAQGAATTVALRTYNPSVATLPASVIVPSGAASATFTVTTRATTSSDFAVIEAEAGGIIRSTTVTTTAPPTGPFLASLLLFPASVGGGGPVTGRVTFNAPATQAAIVELTSSNPAVVHGGQRATCAPFSQRRPIAEPTLWRATGRQRWRFWRT